MTAPDEADPARRSHLGLISSAVALFAPLLYVLSTGPIECLYEHDLLPDFLIPALRVIYSPLAWLMDNSPLIRDWLRWYMELWTG